MQLTRKLRSALAIGAVGTSLAFGLVAPVTSGAATPSGTITYAEGATASPNYIFPYYSSSWCSVANTSQFQALMFRPLYWFGLGGSALIQPKLSTAYMPVYSNGNKTVTITMKGWKFKDGQTVNAKSVMFFINMWKAVPQDFCTYAPGSGFPDQVASARAVGQNKVVITLKTSTNPNWWTYNQLSTITPMPDTWDLTSGGHKANCAGGAYGAASTIVACKNVYNYLDSQAQNTSTFTGKMWQSGADGPWMLTKFDNLGNATFQPNPKYSGPQKAQVAYFKEVAFTQATAEENALLRPLQRGVGNGNRGE